MKQSLILISLLIVSLNLFGQTIPSRRQNVDSMVFSWNLTYYHDADELADTLTSSFTNDSEKVRAIFFWVTQYISYDWEKYHQDQDIALEVSHNMDKDGNIDKDKQIKRTLVRKRGVCQEYAELFAYLCNSTKIKCEVITGYGTGLCADWLLSLDAGRINHAWNAVMINKKWYLLDATWASGTGTKGVKRVRNDFYYLTPPQEFVKDHYPKDTQWQLLDNPIDLKTFIQLAKLK